MKDKKDFKVEEDVSALQKAMEGLGKFSSSKLLHLKATSLNKLSNRLNKVGYFKNNQ